MGEVWKAENLRLKKTVAIKTLSPQLLADEEAKLRFLREARLAAKLDHPNIATVFDVEESDDLVFIVMEFIEGESLDKRIKNGGMDRREAIKVITEVGDALAEAHKHRIIHRDIKPHNIMITKAGRVKVLDFGLAKLLPTGQLADTPETATIEATALTGPGVTFGTRKYMSPEQWLSPDVDERSDIFSFGVVMFEMLVGELPFEGYQLSGIISTQSAMLSGVFQSVPKEFQPIITKALAKDRNSRYQSVAELVRDVQDLSGQVEATVDEARTVPLGAKTEVAGEVATLPLGVKPEAKVTPKSLPTLIQALVLLVPSLGLIRLAGATAGKEIAVLYIVLAFGFPIGVFSLQRKLAGRITPLNRLVKSTDSRVVGFSFVTLVVVLAAAFSLQELSGFLASLGDWRYGQRPIPARKEIVLIGIDSESKREFLKTNPGASELKNWRRYHGQLLKRIVEHGQPTAIGFDVYFGDPSEFDIEFATAIQNTREKGIPVIVGAAFNDREKRFDPIIPAIKEAVGDAIGHPVVLEESGNVVRSLPLVLRERLLTPDPVSGSNRVDHPAISLLMLNRGQFDQDSYIPGSEARLEDQAVPLEERVLYVKNLPTDRFVFEVLNISFAKERFQQLRYFDVYQGRLNSEGQLPPNFFQGKYVLIGAAGEFEELAQSPREQVYRFELHASAMNTILEKLFIRRIYGFPVLVVVVIASFIVFGVGVRYGQDLKVLLPVVAGVIVALFGVSYLLFKLASLPYWLDSSYAMLAAISVAGFLRLTGGRLK
jgi:CHASE2 domain-containing sensor protein/tRNA A-37 threonylcarbamoyl transferase component Bud32